MNQETIVDEQGNQDIHVGVDCPPGSPAGRRVAFGIRATAIAAGAAVTFTVSSVRKLSLRCVNIPPLQGVNFRLTSMKIADVENVVSANGTTAGGTQTGTGVSGAEFAPWGNCVGLLEGQCLDSSVPVVIVAVNDSAAAATLSIDFSGETM